MQFVSLHGHTSFSSGDGHGSPAEHIQRVKSLGMTHIGITEHGNVSSHVQIEKEALKSGIKPIYGVEAYVTVGKEKAKFHQTVLASSEEGYRQLSRLVTRSWDEGFFYKPTMDVEWLLDPELTSELVLLSGCADSYLSCLLAGGKAIGPRLFEEVDIEDFDTFSAADAAMELAKRFKDVYGSRYFLEVQPFSDYKRTCYLNQKIVQIGKALNIEIVATADVHYPAAEDWEMQRVANSIAWHVPVSSLEEKRDYKAGNCSYPLSDLEIAQRLSKTGMKKKDVVRAIKNTRVVAEMCEGVELPKTPPIRYSESDGTDKGAKKLLLEAIKEGIKWRKSHSESFRLDYEERKKEYTGRIKKELRTIIPKHFSDYFLINQQIIGWAKDQGIAVGPGRGSAAGSLVCYLLRITEINPMFFPQMVFERFLDPGRMDDPDIDTDYQDDRRNEVFDFTREAYGEANVGNIGNFSRYRGKSAIKAVGKAFGTPISATEKFCTFIAEAPAGDAREFDTAEDAAAAFPEAKEIIEANPELALAFRLEGDMRTLGIHAAGMVISNLPISNTCAIYKREKSNGDEAEVVAFDKRDAAYLKMLKLDCLGLSTMTIISDVLGMVEGLTLNDLYALPYDDEETLKSFADDDLTGIFQFEGRATRGVVRDIFKDREEAIPDIMQLADINALSRPGSLSSGMTRQYIKVERGAAIEKIHPVVDKILAETNGCLVYQEQVMKIGSQFGGLDDTEIGRLRKIIGAKEMGGAFEAFWIKFRDGAKELHGAEEAKARQVWDYMAASASYLFNVAHAISYAVVAYWTMYLKTHYPAEFFAASLRNAAKKGKTKGKADPQLAILQDVIQHHLTVSPPVPALSRESWWVNQDKTGVIAGFTQLPRVGVKVAEKIVQSRDKAPFYKWSDLPGKVSGFGPKTAKAAEDFVSKNDPFGIQLTNDALNTVMLAISSGDTYLSAPTASSATIPAQEGETVVYLGHVIAVKIIDVIGEMRTRENLTTQEVKARLERPELATKAKIICSDTGGTEVHINVGRYDYPKLAKEIAEIDEKAVYAVHVVGRANNAFGPAIQGSLLTAIELVEE